MSGEQELFNFSDFGVNQSLMVRINVTTSTNNDTAPLSEFKLPFWRQVLWFTLFTVMVLVGTVWNGLVIWIVWANKNMRTVTNYPLVNLAVSDALTLTLNTIFNFYTMLHNVWVFGEYCKLNQFISPLCISVSVLTLMAISIDRYMALVVDVTRGPPSKRGTLIVGAVIWAVSATISVPAAVINEYTPGNDTHNYNVGCTVITYFVPIGTMTYCYKRVGYVLRRSEGIGECIDAQQLNAIEDRKRMVLMMKVIVTLFMVSWVPYHGYFVVVDFFPYLSIQPFVQDMYLSFYLIAMSHAMYHPLIYWYYLRKNCFQKIYTRCCCGQGEREEAGKLESSGWSLSVFSSTIRRGGSNIKSTRRTANGSLEEEIE